LTNSRPPLVTNPGKIGADSGNAASASFGSRCRITLSRSSSSGFWMSLVDCAASVAPKRSVGP
jgi:hypothetical protein